MNESLKNLLRAWLPRAVTPHRILSGPLRGAVIVTSWHDYPAAILGRTERPLLEWFAQHVKPGETWLDIGAHYGYTAIALSRLVGPAGRVFAFEPMITTAGYLAQTRALNQFAQLTVVPTALSATTDVQPQQLPVTRGMVDSTVASGGWVETFLVARGDWLWPRICGGAPRVDGVKIDVQGMEIEVVRGLTEVLGQQHPKLVVELHTGVDRAEFLALLETLGYARRATPVEPMPGEVEPVYVDDRSYAFALRC